MVLRCKRFAGIAILLITWSVAMGADESYAIKMRPVFKPGDEFDTRVECIQTDNMTIASHVAGDAPREIKTDRKGDLTARVKIIAADEKGTATSLTVTIAKFTDGADKDLVPPGRIIEVKRDDKRTIFAIQGGGDISHGAKSLFLMLYPDLSPDHWLNHIDDDRIFGGGAPRKVGESWPVDAESAANAASGDQMIVDSKKVKGETTLKGIENLNAGRALRLVSTMSATDAKLRAPSTILTVNTYNIEWKLDGLYPMDRRLPIAESDVTMDLTMKTRSTDTGMTVDEKMHWSVKETTTPRKK